MSRQTKVVVNIKLRNIETGNERVLLLRGGSDSDHVGKLHSPYDNLKREETLLDCVTRIVKSQVGFWIPFTNLYSDMTIDDNCKRCRDKDLIIHYSMNLDMTPKGVGNIIEELGRLGKTKTNKKVSEILLCNMNDKDLDIVEHLCNNK